MYEIDFSKQATKFIRNLEKNIKERIKAKVREVKKNPFRYLEHYEGNYYHKLTIGDYRALIDVDFKRRILFVRVMDKGGKIYRN